jgi:hypothetical protein
MQIGQTVWAVPTHLGIYVTGLVPLIEEVSLGRNTRVEPSLGLDGERHREISVPRATLSVCTLNIAVTSNIGTWIFSAAQEHFWS